LANRERVIVEIENLEQALKVEQTVRTGYCDPIAENLLAWIAVEEDLASSYQKLSQKYTELDAKELTDMLSTDSLNNVKILHALLKSVEEFGATRDRRQQMIERLIKHEPKDKQ
jgi:hypothetical protein